MASIKVQKLVLNDDGSVRSGSASILISTYDTSIKGNCRKTVREKLGKIVYIDDRHTSGIFISPSRGLVEYDARQDEFLEVSKDDPRIAGRNVFAEPAVHTVFGDAYLVLCFLQKCGMASVLRETFGSDRDYEKALGHLLYTVCRNGSKISCDDFLGKSFASYVLQDVPSGSLGSDTPYFTMMGDDKVKVAFFRAFIRHMRTSSPDFGIGCYVDSTPLPNDIADNPLNALCSHGVAGASNQTRLALVLDENTGLPVWFQAVPGNVLDFSTLAGVMSNVSECLDIRIDSVVLDAGYVTRSVVERFNLDSELVTGTDGQPKRRTMIARMPAQKGYPHKKLYNDTKNMIHNARHEFIRQSHTYFGYRKETEIFGKRINAHIYVDKDNALTLGRKNREKDEDAYNKLSMAEKNWHSVKYGYFVLVSNTDESPAAMLDEYFGRTSIETVFKTGKEYLELLPLSKWNRTTVLGKLLFDTISTIVYLLLLRSLKEKGMSVTKLLGSASSLMCMKKKDRMIEVETPNKGTKAAYKNVGISIPSTFMLNDFCKALLLTKNMQ